ncbi:hypothetical protein D3C76_1058180 [compost metagenome]
MAAEDRDSRSLADSELASPVVSQQSSGSGHTGTAAVLAQNLPAPPGTVLVAHPWEALSGRNKVQASTPRGGTRTDDPLDGAASALHIHYRTKPIALGTTPKVAYRRFLASGHTRHNQLLQLGGS